MKHVFFRWIGSIQLNFIECSNHVRKIFHFPKFVHKFKIPILKYVGKILKHISTALRDEKLQDFLDEVIYYLCTYAMV